MISGVYRHLYYQSDSGTEISVKEIWVFQADQVLLSGESHQTPYSNTSRTMVPNLLQCNLSHRKRLYRSPKSDAVHFGKKFYVYLWITSRAVICTKSGRLSVSVGDSRWLGCFVDIFDSCERSSLYTRISPVPLTPWVRHL